MPDSRGASTILSLPAWLREARWLNRRRARAYGFIFLLMTVLVAIARIALSLFHATFLGQPLFADYVSFWSAGRLALAGQPAAVYDVARHWAVQRSVFPRFGYEAFFYPPVFLLLCTPLALPGFYPSFIGFLGFGLLGYGLAMRRLLPGAGVLFLGFPAVAMNLIYGQNGFLTALLFAAALLALPRRALLAGMCFGCLSYKPHLAFAIPLALAAARQWRALLAMAGTVALLALGSLAAFGAATWQAFFTHAVMARRTLTVGLVNNDGWASLYRAALQLGGTPAVAGALQAAMSLGVLAAMVLACRRRPAAITGVLPLAALAATPFLLVYDLTLLAIPMAWMLGEARQHGFLSWERIVLATAFVTPLLTVLANHASLPICPAVLLALFVLVLRRIGLSPSAFPGRPLPES